MKNRSLSAAIVMLLITMNGLAQVRIGTQVWMETNLDVSTFRNGDAIPQANTDEEWVKAGKAGKPAWCYYRFDPENGPEYGKLYNGFAVTDPRGLAPGGWHMPTDAEWETLINYLGGSDIAGQKMKTTSGWNQDCKAGTNESGFSGLPGGTCYTDGAYAYKGYNCFWWSATEYFPEDPSCGSLHTSCRDNSVFLGKETKRDGLAVRCVKAIDAINLAQVKIGTQTWTSKNLNISSFSNGDAIPEIKTNEEWKAAMETCKPAWCYYNNDPENGKKYGKLYNWYAVHDPRGLAPAGWHIPSKPEWLVLYAALGGDVVAGGKMKEAGDTNWTTPNTGATNSSGFTGRPGGYRIRSGTFNNIGKYGLWWSSGNYDAMMSYNFAAIAYGEGDKDFAISVRCVKD